MATSRHHHSAFKCVQVRSPRFQLDFTPPSRHHHATITMIDFTPMPTGACYHHFAINAITLNNSAECNPEGPSCKNKRQIDIPEPEVYMYVF
jgi:hypothetical protein